MFNLGVLRVFDEAPRFRSALSRRPEVSHQNLDLDNASRAATRGVPEIANPYRFPLRPYKSLISEGGTPLVGACWLAIKVKMLRFSGTGRRGQIWWQGKGGASLNMWRIRSTHGSHYLGKWSPRCCHPVFVWVYGMNTYRPDNSLWPLWDG